MKLELTTLIVLAAASASPALAQTRRPFGVSVPNRINVSQTTTSSSSCMNDILSIRGGAVQESLTLGDLDSKIQTAALQGKLTVVDFTATWCGPCKMIAPVFKDLSEEFASSANFVKVDVDQNAAAAQKYGVSAMPTFLFIKGGEVVDQLQGANSARLREMISEWSL
mmetsp:Transcript_11768/g.21231  ORF Transcript_11768/g.21231 Transcript_11768/m.21231 type:complete len:167 (+) Transcript_11768:55-555(+)|eukprot:CAMPEP_0201607096 /NCGR_PEP_ID=MMETSP0492-20130828/6336_1 /ASSEMBLY_ACC=CAM_ASM_000837 /TAXON_ID=420259 /ORGANISM="Thalassiosira gravida, Strain GMp14c1" /LENGTH=166 /DNA_ID=CAMNT_0048071633 /DNA_START=93 /DNA_END=596 /DNA_ORIENTATION=-